MTRRLDDISYDQKPKERSVAIAVRSLVELKCLCMYYVYKKVHCRVGYHMMPHNHCSWQQNKTHPFPQTPPNFFLLTYPIHHLSLSFALNSITDLISVWPIIQVKSFAFSPKFWILKYTFLYPQVNFNYLLLIGFQFQSFEIFFFFFGLSRIMWKFKTLWRTWNPRMFTWWESLKKWNLLQFKVGEKKQN